MDPIQYLNSLITGIGISSIPVQKSELELLKMFILQDRARLLLREPISQ